MGVEDKLLVQLFVRLSSPEHIEPLRWERNKNTHSPGAGLCVHLAVKRFLITQKL